MLTQSQVEVEVACYMVQVQIPQDTCATSD